MEEITEEPVQVVARMRAIDIGKAGLVACVRVPPRAVDLEDRGKGGQKVRFSRAAEATVTQRRGEVVMVEDDDEGAG
ncbi:hypothetical protein DLE60_17010 [Micromonospora globispora]|uniref:hypothetical protein n=1 Tax=Micromonospora globispora TaxID=1450148 RepID=UPI000D6EB06C|nr:hypothetical protein [Micromonospora globispora]PWU59325.1 hypothetical protein DLE60_17010 [Micromonospora globispora]